MTPFEILVLGHFVADWLFQTKKQAYGKLIHLDIRIKHCCIYSIIMCWVYWIFIKWDTTTSGNFILVSYLFLTHLLFDTPEVKLWWCRVIKREDNPPEWLMIGIDQIFHLVILVPLVYAKF